eukprot:1157266-Pelagomonas_calceolata.AAC.2
MALCYTITPANGRIWSVERPVEKDALVCVLAQPASKVNQGLRAQSFTAVAYDDKAEHLAGADNLGNVYSFNLKANRVCKLETAGTAGTACCFSPGAGRLTLLLVARFQYGDKGQLHLSSVPQIALHHQTPQDLSMSISNKSHQLSFHPSINAQNQHDE